MPLAIPEFDELAAKDPLMHEIITRIIQSANAISVLSGNGSPESIVPAAPGTEYIQKDSGGTITGIWMKTKGSDAFGWQRVSNFGSAQPNVTSQLAFTTTPTTATIFWDGTNGSVVLKIRRPDGSFTVIPAGNQQITGLTATHTYKVFPYYSERNKIVRFVHGGEPVGEGIVPLPGAGINPPVAWDTASFSDFGLQTSALALSDRIGLGIIPFTTPATGSGGGSGGGGGLGCLRTGMIVDHRSKGPIPAQQLQIGDAIRSRRGWTHIEAFQIVPEPDYVRVRVGSNYVDVAPNTRFRVWNWQSASLGDIGVVPVETALEGDYVEVRGIGLGQIIGKENIRDESESKVVIACWPDQEYFAGALKPEILIHNVKVT